MVMVKRIYPAQAPGLVSFAPSRRQDGAVATGATAVTTTRAALELAAAYALDEVTRTGLLNERSLSRVLPAGVDELTLRAALAGLCALGAVEKRGLWFKPVRGPPRAVHFGGRLVALARAPPGVRAGRALFKAMRPCKAGPTTTWCPCAGAARAAAGGRAPRRRKYVPRRQCGRLGLLYVLPAHHHGRCRRQPHNAGHAEPRP